MSRRVRHAPEHWVPGYTRVRYIDPDDPDFGGLQGTFVENSQPTPLSNRKGWVGVRIKFEGYALPLDVDPADLEVVANPNGDPA